jgi:hypothetical protein
LSAFYAGDSNYSATATTLLVVESVDAVPVAAPMLNRWVLLFLGGSIVLLVPLATRRRRS